MSAVTDTPVEGATYIVGHLRGRTLAEVFAAESPVAWPTVADELAARLAALPPSTIAWVDPGLGFGKGADPEANLALLRHAGDLAAAVNRPVVVGPSRKRFVRRLAAQGNLTRDIDAASVEAAMLGVRAGAQVVRAHNVTLLRTALTAYNNEE